MKSALLAGVACAALLLATVSLVVTLLQSPESITKRTEIQDGPLLAISGGPLFIGSPLPWKYDPASRRLHYNSDNVADRIVVRLDRDGAEERWVRETGTPLSISLTCGNGVQERVVLLASDRDGQNLEITFSEKQERLDSSYLQILPNLLRDPAYESRITHVEVEGCRREAGGGRTSSYDLNGRQILLLVDSGR